VTENKRVRWIRWLLGALGLAVLVVVLFLTLAPTGRYLARAGWEEGRILWRRHPIAQLVADPATPAPLAAKLRIVLAARAFARD
jgi:predicted aminopeptidase